MNSRDYYCQLVCPNLITADKCSNDVGREFYVERWRRADHRAATGGIERIEIIT
jgi:hypothetical protein